MKYYVIESEKKFTVIQVFESGEHVFSRPIFETTDPKALPSFLNEDPVPANAVSQGKTAGLTGDPPVMLNKRKRCLKLLRRK
jgi:hypothetical protein